MTELEHLLMPHADDCHGIERCTCGWFERLEELRMTETEKKKWRQAREDAFARGLYTMKVPDVTTGGWDVRAWCNHVKFNNPDLRGYDDGRET